MGNVDKSSWFYTDIIIQREVFHVENLSLSVYSV